MWQDIDRIAEGMAEEKANLDGDMVDNYDPWRQLTSYNVSDVHFLSFSLRAMSTAALDSFSFPSVNLFRNRVMTISG